MGSLGTHKPGRAKREAKVSWEQALATEKLHLRSTKLASCKSKAFINHWWQGWEMPDGPHVGELEPPSLTMLTMLATANRSYSQFTFGGSTPPSNLINCKRKKTVNTLQQVTGCIWLNRLLAEQTLVWLQSQNRAVFFKMWVKLPANINGQNTTVKHLMHTPFYHECAS